METPPFNPPHLLPLLRGRRDLRAQDDVPDLALRQRLHVHVVLLGVVRQDEVLERDLHLLGFEGRSSLQSSGWWLLLGRRGKGGRQREGGVGDGGRGVIAEQWFVVAPGVGWGMEGGAGGGRQREGGAWRRAQQGGRRWLSLKVHDARG